MHAGLSRRLLQRHPLHKLQCVSIRHHRCLKLRLLKVTAAKITAALRPQLKTNRNYSLRNCMTCRFTFASQRNVRRGVISFAPGDDSPGAVSMHDAVRVGRLEISVTLFFATVAIAALKKFDVGPAMPAFFCLALTTVAVKSLLPNFPHNPLALAAPTLTVRLLQSGRCSSRRTRC